MDAAFRKELEDSLYVHFPLKPDDSRSRDVKDLEKAVVNTTSLWDGTSLTPWKFEGEGEYSVEPEGIFGFTPGPGQTTGRKVKCGQRMLPRVRMRPLEVILHFWI